MGAIRIRLYGLSSIQQLGGSRSVTRCGQVSEGSLLGSRPANFVLATYKLVK